MGIPPPRARMRIYTQQYLALESENPKKEGKVKRYCQEKRAFKLLTQGLKFQMIGYFF